jgi:parallel beta-helix repeat protein
LYGGVIRGSTFTGNTAASSGGAIELYSMPGNFLIEDTEITGNTAGSDGGGLYAGGFYYGATLRIANSTISNNTAVDEGGGIAVGFLDGAVVIENSTISGNTASDGGGLYFYFDSDTARLTVTGSTIADNTATAGRGGGVSVNFYEGGAVSIDSTTISGNTATGDGGGIALYSDENTGAAFKFTMTNSTVTGNSSDDDGGGVSFYVRYDAGVTFTIGNTTITNNTAGAWGGGVFFNIGGEFTGNFLIDSSTISGNTADDNGGGVALYTDDGDGFVRFVDSEISGNTATTGNGGGVYLYDGGGSYLLVEFLRTTVSGNNAVAGDGGGISIRTDSEAGFFVTSSTISGNTANGNGGGIYLYTEGGSIVLVNSTVSGNTATTGDGGGIYIGNIEEESLINNSTIVFNAAPAGTGGGVFLESQDGDSPDLFVQSSIVFGNTSTAGNDLGTGANPTAIFASFSLIGDSTVSGSGTFTDLGFNLFGVDPLLGALQDNGGPTFTHALLRGSPAINAGFNFAGTLYDQRGQPFLRTFGDATDIGAFEFQLPPPEPIVVGAGAGGSGEFVVYNLDGTERARITAFDPSVTGGIRVATADVTGDGVYDYIVGAGPGAPSLVKIYDGSTLNQIAILIAFEATFTGGVYVAGGDIDGDGFAEVVVTPDQGGGPVVAVYDGEALAGGSVVQLARFLGIQDENFRGGARVAVGDVTGDGLADIVVAAGFEGGPRVTVWEATAVLSGNTGADATPYANFFAFEDTLRNGTFVAVGDLDGDGFGDVIVGAGPGGGPRVVVFDGAALATGTLDQTASFFAGDDTLRNGVPVAVADLNGDAELDVVAGVGEPAAGTAGVPSTVRVYSASSLQDDPLNPVATLDPFPGFTGGVFVG